MGPVVPEDDESVGVGELLRGEAGGPFFASALTSLTISKFLSLIVTFSFSCFCACSLFRRRRCSMMTRCWSTAGVGAIFSATCQA